ncbi:hypothetical protein PISMIDRAFT_235094 [Pisolithus microcarpus 441]|uniref:Uncharacterized protein n=1 Tax=Pisolithus microcarpus 441 TaxID=765257 RepID=A0A0C9YSY3_9AGAM|nr:hypothetical protein PISMIDRAFT_235094 [Pisolithus microcarpus 441]
MVQIGITMSCTLRIRARPVDRVTASTYVGHSTTRSPTIHSQIGHIAKTRFHRVMFTSEVLSERGRVSDQWCACPLTSAYEDVVRLVQHVHMYECKVILMGWSMFCPRRPFRLLRRYDMVQVMSGEKDKKADPLEDPIDEFCCTRMVSESSATPVASDRVVKTPLQKEAYSAMCKGRPGCSVVVSSVCILNGCINLPPDMTY